MIPETLFSLLADQGIKLRRYDPGNQQNSGICPRCGGGSHRERSLNVKIDADGQGASWKCHRGSCGWTDGARLAAAKRPPPPRKAPVNRAPLPWHTPWQEEDRPEWLYEFFADRHIGKRTVDSFGIYARDRSFPGLGERPAIVFPYRWKGNTVARKYRPYPDKNPQSQENTGEPTLFNADALDGADTVIWVEGEPDVMAVAECGHPNVVSLRDGAPQQATFRPDDARFEALRTHADELAKVRHFVLAGDMDAPGLALREELARRLGRHKVSLVTWPEDCKDACDTLCSEGGYHALRGAIEAAVPYPIDGIYQLKPGTLDELYAQPPPATMTTGASASDRLIKLPTEGRLIVITGTPNHGKSTWTRFLAVHTAERHGRQWLVFTPEHEWQHYLRECAETFIGRPFYPKTGLTTMTAEERREASEFLETRIRVMQCDNETQAPTLDWILERAAFLVLRDGVSDVLLDPWNEIEHQRGEHSETEYTGRVLQRFRSFAQRHGCNVWIVAHPAKPPPLRSGEKRRPPTAYDISGSANWTNKPDIGLTVWSPKIGEVELIMWKARFHRWGQRGAVAKLDFDQSCGRYRDPVMGTADDDPATPPHWTEGAE